MRRFLPTTYSSHTPMAPYLSIVIPAYNEARRLPPTLRELAEFRRSYPGKLEVIVVVEKSTDGTLEIARRTLAEQGESDGQTLLIDNPEQRGKGFAVRTGMLRAQGDLILYMDADLSVPLAETHALIEIFAQNPEVHVVIGNRQHQQARITRAQSWLRRSMGQSFNRLLTGLALTQHPDTQCGFKGFRRGAAHAIFAQQQIDGFAFDVEVLMLADALGFRVVDMPVEWLNSAESKVHILRDSLGMIRDAWRIRRALEGRLSPSRQTNRPSS